MNKKKSRSALKARAAAMRERVLEKFPELEEELDAAVAAIGSWDPSEKGRDPLGEFMRKAFTKARQAGMVQTARDRRRIIMSDLAKLHRIFSDKLADLDLSEYYEKAKSSVEESPCPECGVNPSAKGYVEDVLEAACTKGLKLNLFEMAAKLGSRYSLYAKELAESRDLSGDPADNDDDEFFELYLTRDEHAARQEICAGCEFLVGDRCKKFCSCSGDLHASRRRSVKCPENKW